MRRLLRAFRTPIAADTREALARSRDGLATRLRGPRQYQGRAYAGCGALIGAMPRCDFACRGCYLGEDANRIPAASREEVARQLRALREWLGHGGNVQLTDGEVALRDPDDVVWMIREARGLGLVPMLFTHGDGIRRDPGLLRRFMVEGGLSEISIHVDTTQRGRRDPRFRHATREAELNPLRDEFAALVRRLRRETRRPLEAATTVTVTPDNLDGVADVIRWIVANADAFKMVSFQPIAQVGRTESGLAGRLGHDEVWARIEAGLAEHRDGATPLGDHRGHFGHPSCNRMLQALVRRSASGRVRWLPLLEAEGGHFERLAALLDEVGGVRFRLDGRGQALLRLLGLLAAHPRILWQQVGPLARHVLERLAPDGRLAFLAGWLLGREQVAYLNLVSHHFMSAEELASDVGRERLDACVFRVPVGDELLSMCEVNAAGVRDRYYAALRDGREGAGSPAPPDGRAADSPPQAAA